MSASASAPAPRNGHVELIVSRTGHPDRRLLLKPGVLRLGRAEDNDLVLPDIGVSRRHARIVVDDTGVTLEDLGSGNGTLFQGRPVRKKRIEDNDILNIEPFNLRFRINRSGGAVSASDTLGGPRLVLVTDSDAPASIFPIPATGLTLGRATNQAVVLNDPGASRQHAIIFPRQGGCWLQDNRSANGTFVNDERIYQHLIKHDDLLRIGRTVFRLDMGMSASGGDPLSQLWDESGAYALPIREDGEPPMAPFPPPPSSRGMGPSASALPLQPSPAPSSGPNSEPTVALAPQGQGMLLAVVGALLFLMVLIVILVSVLQPQMSTLLERLALRGEEPVEQLEPDTTLPVQVSSDEVGERLVIGRALLAAGRPLEAATPLYQALKAEPDVQELKQLGYTACEAAAMQVLLEGIRQESLSETITSRSARDLSRSADRVSPDELPALRSSLEDVLKVFPDNSQAIRALGTVDSRLAGLAVEKVQAASEESDLGTSWQLLEEALVLSPTTGAAARASWSHLKTSRAAAVPLIEQALSMEAAGLFEDASRLYSTASSHLPGQTEPLERLARARIDSLARARTN